MKKHLLTKHTLYLSDMKSRFIYKKGKLQGAHHD